MVVRFCVGSIGTRHNLLVYNALVSRCHFEQTAETLEFRLEDVHTMHTIRESDGKYAAENIER